MYFMLDNYDSFVYNLSAYVKELGREILVKRADQITVAEVEAMNPEGIIISPGPGKPSEAHLSHALLDQFAGEIPILGVCLGHQVIVEKYDGRVEKGARPMHGKVTPIINTGEGIFRGLFIRFCRSLRPLVPCLLFCADSGFSVFAGLAAIPVRFLRRSPCRKTVRLWSRVSS